MMSIAVYISVAINLVCCWYQLNAVRRAREAREDARRLRQEAARLLMRSDPQEATKVVEEFFK